MIRFRPPHRLALLFSGLTILSVSAGCQAVPSAAGVKPTSTLAAFSAVTPSATTKTNLTAAGPSITASPLPKTTTTPSPLPGREVATKVPVTPSPVNSPTARATNVPSQSAPTPTAVGATPREAPTADRGQTALAKARAVTPISVATLWEHLAGFSGKTNQQREGYVAEQLFPTVGLKDPVRTRVLYGGAWGDEYGNWDNLHNVSALRKGSLPDGVRKKIVVGGHFDKVTYPGRSATPGISDGILDNGSGVALVASLAEALPTPFNDIEFIGFASEEPPPYFNGSRVYFSDAQNTQRVVFFLNFDCMGTGDMAMVEGSADQELSKMALSVAKDVGISLAWRPASTQTNSDQLIAQGYGVRTIGFASTGYDRQNIHVPEDNLTAVDPNAYYQHYVLALRILTYLDAWYAN